MKIHMVKKGDTMYAIAKKYGVGVEQLLQLNPDIANPDVIDVGTKVKVPSGGGKPKPSAGDWMHQHLVKQGDTLWNLSKAWGIPLADMIQANPQLKNPNVLMTGEMVNIPKAVSSPFTPLALPQLPDLQHMPHGFPATPGHGKAYTGPIVGKAPTGPITPPPKAPTAKVPPADIAPAAPLPTPHEAMPYDVDLFKQFQIPATEVFSFCDFPPPPQLTIPSALECPPSHPLMYQTPAMTGVYPCPPGTVPVSDWTGALPLSAPQTAAPFMPQFGVSAGGYGSFTGHADVTAGVQGFAAHPAGFGAPAFFPAAIPGYQASGLFGPPLQPYYGPGPVAGAAPFMAGTAAYSYPTFGAYVKKPCTCGCMKREETEGGKTGAAIAGREEDESVKTGVRGQTAVKESFAKKPASKASVKSSASRPAARKAEARRRFGQPWLNR
ncbi:LysM peptidoglycan-binding domain-containing protein [Paenibacillus darwinianus]|uniref:LysM peptidoglycan-binding domain-containing protein n=1 Tax=Paenibacillus darwinianus TaxID=1380763 RepID=UPI000A61C146|nr:LysM peptidoglycan-binding domain-containing protein [Paenibacillus darwinianus]